MADDLDLACEDTQRINVWLAKAVRGEPLPSSSDPEHARTLQAITNIIHGPSDRRTRATISIALASMGIVHEALAVTAQAERDAPPPRQRN